MSKKKQDQDAATPERNCESVETSLGVVKIYPVGVRQLPALAESLGRIALSVAAGYFDTNQPGIKLEPGDVAAMICGQVPMALIGSLDLIEATVVMPDGADFGDLDALSDLPAVMEAWIEMNFPESDPTRVTKWVNLVTLAKNRLKLSEKISAITRRLSSKQS